MLTEIRGVGLKTEAAFNKINIYTIRDLLNAVPKSYIDLSSAKPLEKAKSGDFCLCRASIFLKRKPIKKKRLIVFKADAKSGDKKVELVWFNTLFVSKVLEEGKDYCFYGKVSLENGKYIFINPKYELDEENNGDGLNIISHYRTGGLIGQKKYARIVEEALSLPQTGSLISADIEKKYNLMPLYDAFCYAHKPDCLGQRLQNALYRIETEKLIRLIGGYRAAKSDNKDNKYGIYKYQTKLDLNLYEKKLSFCLTPSQKEVLIKASDEIYKSGKFNGILCGDVGSGKTIVGFILALYAAANGLQSAIMAPAELLCRQHFKALCPLCEKFSFKTAILTSATKAKERKEIIKQLQNHEIDILVGTQSLLNEEIKFDKLSFVVQDEQHKFGVAQRTSLIDKGNDVNVLTLSATPIPRSLQLVAYGDIERFYIERRYKSNIVTSIVKKEKRHNMWKYLEKECICGNGQAYIVAPKIENCEDEDENSNENVNALYDELLEYFPEEKLGCLHGKMPAEKKSEIIKRFDDGQIRILISTTVIEVGINIINANYIVIMQAENFGLATLHQLRGRVGRGGQKAFCFLYTEKPPSDGLKFLCECSDGLKVAEKDFEIRGCGEIFGIDQSGDSSIKGITVTQLDMVKEIVDSLDLKVLKTVLKDDIKNYGLKEISLT